MSLAARLSTAESPLTGDTLWREATKLAPKLGGDLSALYEEARSVLANYGHRLVPGPDGTVDPDPALRAMAKKEGLDYNDLARLARRHLPRRRKRQAKSK
jgi:hypothetical protein